MTSDDFDTVKIDDEYDSEEFPELFGEEPMTLDDWKAKNVKNSSVAWMNQFIHGGPPEDFDRFILASALAQKITTTRTRVTNGASTSP